MFGTLISIKISANLVSLETLVEKLGFVNEKKNYFCKAKIA
jgi:hypothetical protein